VERMPRSRAFSARQGAVDGCGVTIGRQCECGMKRSLRAALGLPGQWPRVRVRVRVRVFLRICCNWFKS